MTPGAATVPAGATAMPIGAAASSAAAPEPPAIWDPFSSKCWVTEYELLVTGLFAADGEPRAPGDGRKVHVLAAAEQRAVDGVGDAHHVAREGGVLAHRV